MASARRSTSAGPKPSWLIHTVPSRRPVDENAPTSPGMVLRLTTIPATSRMREAMSPDRCTPSWLMLLVSMSSRWLSLPPPTMRMPREDSPWASPAALSTMRCCRARNCSVRASRRATARAAMVFRCGPPCSPGKTARSSLRAMSRLWVISIAPRGPQRLLWVVVETTSAMPMGLGWTPAATRPEMWAMSASR